MTATIVGVHGIGKYAYHRRTGSAERAAAAISDDWAQWLRVGLGGSTPADLQVAYYAHHLHRGTPQGADDDPAVLEPGAQELLISWVEQLQPRRQIALGPRTAMARQATEWLTQHFGAAARLAAIAFCRDAHTYLVRPDGQRRAAAREEVAATIARHNPRIIIAHSLGSVVTYEAMWEHPELRPELMLTIGSPLGMPNVVFDRLQPAPTHNRGRRPPGVGSWVNLADIGDIFAIPRDLPARFIGINRHHSDLTIDEWDFHSAKRYLAHPTIARVVRAHLESSSGQADPAA